MSGRFSVRSEGLDASAGQHEQAAAAVQALCGQLAAAAGQIAASAGDGPADDAAGN